VVLSSLLTHKRLHLFVLSLILLVISISGPPSIGIYGAVISMDINRLIEIYSNSQTLIRMPDTYLRILVFSTAIFLLIMMPIVNIKKVGYRISNNKLILMIFIFFAFYLSTSYLYNFVAILLLLTSIYYYVFFFEYKLEKYEFFFISSYLIIFLYPFYHSLYIPSSLYEVDNYLRFLFAIPIYLLSRSIISRDAQLLYSINIISIVIGLSALYYYLFHDDIRVRGYTSTSTIFSNISLLFTVLSFFTIKKIYQIKSRHIYLPIIGTILALVAWSTTGSRGSLVAIFFLLILILFNKRLRDEYLFSDVKTKIISVLVFSIIFFQSGSLVRIQNAYHSTYNFIYDDSPHHWSHKDSIVPRISIWNASLNMIYENTILGIGLTNYNKELNSQIVSGKFKPIRQDQSNYTAGMNHAHSQYLDIFAKTGIIGFLTLMYFIIMNYYHIYRNLKNNKDNIAAFMGLLILTSYVSYMMYHTILSHQQSTLFMTFSLAIFAGLSYSNSQEKKD
jgi:O-antigen ligase